MNEWQVVSWGVTAAVASLVFLGIVADDLCVAVRSIETAEAAAQRVQQSQDEVAVAEVVAEGMGQPGAD